VTSIRNASKLVGSILASWKWNPTPASVHSAKMKCLLDTYKDMTLVDGQPGHAGGGGEAFLTRSPAPGTTCISGLAGSTVPLARAVRRHGSASLLLIGKDWQGLDKADGSRSPTWTTRSRRFRPIKEGAPRRCG